MLLTVFASPVRPQKHSGRMLSCQQRGFKRVGLHYIDFKESAIASKPTCTTYKAKNRLNHPSRDELGLVLAGRVESQYLVGSASARGHSISSHSSGWGWLRQ